MYPDPSMRTGLQYVVWELTLRCDLACKHCGSRAGKAREDEMSTEEALGVVGVNLLHGAFFGHHEPEQLVESLLDNLSTQRIDPAPPCGIFACISAGFDLQSAAPWECIPERSTPDGPPLSKSPVSHTSR